MKRLIVLALLVASAGCSSAEAHDLALKHQKHLGLLHRCSAPKGVDQATWDEAWAESDRAAANLVKATE